MTGRLLIVTNQPLTIPGAGCTLPSCQREVRAVSVRRIYRFRRSFVVRSASRSLLVNFSQASVWWKNAWLTVSESAVGRYAGR